MSLSKRTVPHIVQRRQQRALLALTYQSRPLLSVVFPAGPGKRGSLLTCIVMGSLSRGRSIWLGGSIVCTYPTKQDRDTVFDAVFSLESFSHPTGVLSSGSDESYKRTGNLGTSLR